MRTGISPRWPLRRGCGPKMSFQEYKRERKRQIRLSKYTAARQKRNWLLHKEHWKDSRRQRKRDNPYEYLYNLRSCADWFIEKQFLRLYTAYLKNQRRRKGVSKTSP